jgi:multiple sugar transport system ATP-binding protein
MPKINLKDVNKIYPNGFQAVYDFNLEIEEGEFVVLVGPSGCGKSTTLRMIAGLEDISKGEFYIGDKICNQLNPKQRGVAMVFQSYALYPHLSVFDNLAFSLNLLGTDEDTIEEKVKAVADVLGLTDYLDRKPRALSGGQCQRVAVGRAIIRKVDIFLMDEPLSNLDAKQRASMRSEIVELHRRIGATTVYVTHDQMEAMTMADRIVVMKNGIIQQVGTPKELYFEPANTFVASFIGEPPMNLLKSTIDNENIHINQSCFKCLLSDYYSSKEKINPNVIFGFRPEVIKLEKSTDCIEMEVLVELTEMLGDTSNCYARLGDNNIILKIDPHFSLKIGSMIKFYISKSDIYLFDEAGNALRKS